MMRRLLLLSCASLAATLPLTPGKSELSLDAAASAQDAQVVPDAAATPTTAPTAAPTPIPTDIVIAPTAVPTATPSAVVAPHPSIHCTSEASLIARDKPPQYRSSDPCDGSVHVKGSLKPQERASWTSTPPDGIEPCTTYTA